MGKLALMFICGLVMVMVGFQSQVFGATMEDLIPDETNAENLEKRWFRETPAPFCDNGGRGNAGMIAETWLGDRQNAFQNACHARQTGQIASHEAMKNLFFLLLTESFSIPEKSIPIIW